MSGAAEAVQAALVAALTAHAPLADAVTGIFDGPPARAAYPYVAMGAGATGDWSTKTERGREHRIAVTIWDDGDASARMLGLIAAAEDAVEAIGRVLDGNRIVSIAFLRSRVLRDADGPWAGIVEYRLRTIED